MAVGEEGLGLIRQYNEDLIFDAFHIVASHMTSKLTNLHYTGGITPKRVTSGRVHLRHLASRQCN